MTTRTESVAVADGEYSVASATESHCVVNGRRSIAAGIGGAEATESASVACVTGNGATATASHAGAVAVAWGCNSSAQGVAGSTLVLTEWEHEYADFPKHVRLVHVDGKDILADTRYTITNGEITIVKDDNEK